MNNLEPEEKSEKKKKAALEDRGKKWNGWCKLQEKCKHLVNGKKWILQLDEDSTPEGSHWSQPFGFKIAYDAFETLDLQISLGLGSRKYWAAAHYVILFPWLS